MTTKPLKPVLERANVPLKLQAIRKNLQKLEAKDNKTHQDALQIMRLKEQVKSLMEEHIYLVVDNTCL